MSAPERQYLVRLPWPTRRQSPNASRQGDYRGKASAAKKYKDACGWECRAQGVHPVSYESAVVEVTFCPPSRRRFDLDNALASIKQGLDAVADAIGIDDADWSELRLLRGEKVKGGCVLVNIKQGGAGL